MSDLALQLSENGRQWLIHRPLEIVLYVVLAVVVRYLLHRGIDRLVRGNRRDGDSAPRRFGVARLRGALGGRRLPTVRRRTVDDPAKAQRDREARPGGRSGPRPSARSSNPQCRSWC
ncbi:hypothetical protein MTP03_10460 [Tsukamurella sp. PLM1]|nr:hypothetical protein MTP03_10460 [Tsukamurella sp. PLM1]